MEGVIYRVSGTRANGCRSREQLTKDSGEGRKAESDANHTCSPSHGQGENCGRSRDFTLGVELIMKG